MIIECICFIFVKLHWNLRFWNFSRNCLTGDESLPGDSLFVCWFWVPAKGLSGGASLAAMQHMVCTQFSGFLWRA